jgi:hypothetical protein
MNIEKKIRSFRNFQNLGIFRSSRNFSGVFNCIEIFKNFWSFEKISEVLGIFEEF